jgi:WhiB family redox-sensing transcriptional regulator
MSTHGQAKFTPRFAYQPHPLDAVIDQAACTSTDPELFFPAGEEIGTHEHSGYLNKKAARLVCAGCPIRLPCLSYALLYDEVGVWGGLDAKERANLKKGKVA